MTAADRRRDRRTAAADLSPVHFIGIGGAGMSGIARIMLAMGLQVSGSDAKDSLLLTALAAEGAAVHVGHDAGSSTGVRTVVASSAVRETNPELARARELGLQVLHRSAGAGRGQRRAPGRRGGRHQRQDHHDVDAHGDAAALRARPVVLDRRRADRERHQRAPGQWRGLRAGGGRERRHLRRLPPAGGGRDQRPARPPRLLRHRRGGRAGLPRLRPQHPSRRPAGGLRGRRRARPGWRLGPRPRASRVRTYGESDGADVRLADLVLDRSGSGFEVLGDGAPASAGPACRVPGRHNALNALAAWTAIVAVGVPAADALDGRVGRSPAPGAASNLAAAPAGCGCSTTTRTTPARWRRRCRPRARWPAQGRVVVVFQPHLYSRTRDFAAEFGQALGLADEVVVMDVYAAREDPLPGVSGALVADAVPLPPEHVAFVPSWSAVAGAVRARVRPGDLVLTVGAGDVTMLADEVLALLGRVGPAMSTRTTSVRESGAETSARFEARARAARWRARRPAAGGRARGSSSLVGLGRLAYAGPLLTVRTVQVRGVTGADGRAGARGRGRPTGHAAGPGGRRRGGGRRVKALPQVADVSVQRGWPSTLRLVVRPRVAVAAVPASGGGYRLVDASGRGVRDGRAARPRGCRCCGCRSGRSRRTR